MNGVNFAVTGLRGFRIITGIGVVVGACSGYQDMLGKSSFWEIACEGLVGFVGKGSSAKSLRRWGPGRDWERM